MRVLLRRLGPDKGEVALDLPPGAQVRDALRRAGIHPETVLVARDAERNVVPDDEPLREGDVLLVARVVTGGAAGGAGGGPGRGRQAPRGGPRGLSRLRSPKKPL